MAIKNLIKKLTALIIPLTLASCTIHYQKPPTAIIAQQKKTPSIEKIIKKSFSYQTPTNIKRELIEITKDYKHEKITYPSPYPIKGEKNTVKAHYYKPLKGEDLAAIEVFPIMGGPTTISEWLAETLAKDGFATLRFERNAKILRKKDSAKHQMEIMKQAVINAMSGIDWLQQQPEINPKNIGITGVSMGACLTTIVAGIDERVKTGVFILGGGDFASLLTYSKEKSIEKYRNHILETYNITLEEFHKQTKILSKELEPLNYAHRINPENFLMINCVFDKVVPMENAQKLWKAMGKPDWIKLPCGHYTGIAFFPYAKEKMKKKFHQHLRKNEILK